MSYKIPCTIDSQCFYEYKCTDLYCQHIGIWPPDVMQIVTTILLPFLIGIISVGGLGGGAVKVPIFMILLNYQQKIATLIGYCITFGSGLPNAILLMIQKHPYLDRPLIDFNAVSVINSTVLFGTTMGSLINELCPDLYLTILFFLFSLSITPYLWNKAKDQQKAEEAQNKKLEEAENALNQKLMDPQVQQLKSKIDENDYNKQMEEEIIKKQKSILVAASFLETGKDNLKSNLRSAKSSKNSLVRFSYNRLSSVNLKGISAIMYQSKVKKTILNQYKTSQDLKAQDIEEITSEVDFQISMQEQAQQALNNTDKDQQKKIEQDNSAKKVKQTIENASPDNQKSKIVYSKQQLSEIRKSDQQKLTDLNEQELYHLKFLKEDAQLVPFLKMFIMFVNLCLVILLNLLRGDGSSSIIGAKKCSGEYWIFTCLIVVVSILNATVVMYIISKEQKEKRQYGYQFDERDFMYTNKIYAQLFLSGIAGGFLSGAVNFGASLAVLPVLLKLGMHPRVASAVSGVNTAFMSLTQISTVILSEQLTAAQIITFVVIAILGGFIVSKFIYYMVNKYKKQFLILLSVFYINIIINFTNIIYVIQTVLEYKWGSLLGIPDFCD